METIWQWGVEFIVFIQKAQCTTFDIFWNGMTLLGEEGLYFLMIPFIYWVLDKRAGARLAYLLMFSTYINIVLKHMINHPRPFAPEIDKKGVVHNLDRVGSGKGPGIPSGHTQHSAVTWGFLALYIKRWWFWCIATTIVVLIGFSRMYLGVHFPTDVLGGFLLAILILILYSLLEKHVLALLKGRSILIKCLVALLFPILMYLVYSRDNILLITGCFAGFGVGVVLDYEFLKFQNSGPIWKRILSFIIGTVVLAGLYICIKKFIPDVIPLKIPVCMVAGIWMSLGAPWLFQKLGLSPKFNESSGKNPSL